MSNLYYVAPESNLDSYIRRHLGKVHPLERSAKPHVGPFEVQDKRAKAHIAPEAWMAWLHSGHDEAKMLLVAPPAESYDQADAVATSALLTSSSTPAQNDMLLAIPPSHDEPDS